MELLTKAILKQLPSLGKQEGKGKEAIAYVKFFTPDANWTWYAIEYDPVDEMFFGVVKGQFTEYGYFSLKELKTVRGRLGLPIERDYYFEPTQLRDIKRIQNEI